MTLSKRAFESYVQFDVFIKIRITTNHNILECLLEANDLSYKIFEYPKKDEH